MIYGYTRVSTAEQASDGKSSIVDQRRKIEGAAMMRGPEGIAAFFSDPGISGGTPLREREGGEKLLHAVRPGDIVIAAKLDRLFRSSSDALATVEDLARRKVGIVLADIGPDCVTENGTSKLFFSMLAAFAEFERSRIAERVNEGRKAKKQRGGHGGGDAPYGFRVVGSGGDARLVPVPGEQAVVKAMVQLRGAGLGYRAISQALAQDGAFSRSGQPFEATSILRILRRGVSSHQCEPKCHQCMPY